MRRSADAPPAAEEKPTGEYRAGMPVAGDGENPVVPARSRSAEGAGVRQPGALGARTACARTHIARSVHAMTSGAARTHLRAARRDADRAISRGAKCFGNLGNVGTTLFRRAFHRSS